MHPSRFRRPALSLLALLPVGLAAQRPDSAAVLPPIRVAVTRSPESLRTLGASVTVVDSTPIRRGRMAGGLDEALAFVPGVIAANRWNPSLDQKLIIRGFGARANFGVRGVKILIDGIPQTLPDGQSQLTNLDLALVERVEVLRGAASSLHGNAAGGVLAFTSRSASADRDGVNLGFEGGSLGLARLQLGIEGRRGTVAIVGGASMTRSDGFRIHSRSEQRRGQVALAWQLRPATTLTVRGAYADDPFADNPGALTSTEASATPMASAPNNLLRDAGKSVKQGQLSLGLDDQRGPWQSELRLWGLTRTLDNPLAAPAPAPTTANEGLWVGIDRVGTGLRASTTRRLGIHRVTAGIDVQSSRDDRVNRRHRAGTPFGPMLLDQRETVRELGVFAQATLPRGPWELRGGMRWDRTSFDVADAIGSGSGERSMAAVSGNVSLARVIGRATTMWTSVATAFETPTTTELANQPDGSTGLNRVLDPQRSVSFEVGMRTAGTHGQLEAAIWTTSTRDAITPFQEVGGRAYFANAGRTRTRGFEVAGQAPITSGLMALATVTFTDATFRDYEVGKVRLDGRRVAGIPRTVGRLGVRGTLGQLGIDVDHALASSQFADDGNAIEVAGWGSGLTGVRIRWIGGGRRQFAPFVAVQNLFDRQVIGSVTVNGSFGRVFEPAAGRNVTAGATVQF